MCQTGGRVIGQGIHAVGDGIAVVAAGDHNWYPHSHNNGEMGKDFLRLRCGQPRLAGRLTLGKLLPVLALLTRDAERGRRLEATGRRRSLIHGGDRGRAKALLHHGHQGGLKAAPVGECEVARHFDGSGEAHLSGDRHRHRRGGHHAEGSGCPHHRGLVSLWQEAAPPG